MIVHDSKEEKFEMQFQLIQTIVGICASGCGAILTLAIIWELISAGV